MATPTASRKPRAPLTYLLGFVFLLFIGILVFAYVVTRQANPVFLDEHGKPLATQPATSNGH